MNEQERHELFNSLERVLGPAPAATLMPWSGRDCATKSDVRLLKADVQAFEERMQVGLKNLLEQVRQELQQGLDQMRAEFATSLAATTRTVVITVVFALVAAVASNASLIFIAAG